jgi:hypothetical protein
MKAKDAIEDVARETGISAHTLKKLLSERRNCEGLDSDFFKRSGGES